MNFRAPHEHWPIPLLLHVNQRVPIHTPNEVSRSGQHGCHVDSSNSRDFANFNRYGTDVKGGRKAGRQGLGATFPSRYTPDQGRLC